PERGPIGRARALPYAAPCARRDPQSRASAIPRRARPRSSETRRRRRTPSTARSNPPRAVRRVLRRGRPERRADAAARCSPGRRRSRRRWLEVASEVRSRKYVTSYFVLPTSDFFIFSPARIGTLRRFSGGGYGHSQVGL